MKKNLACAFLTALFVITLSQVLALSAGQDSQGSPRAPQAEPAKAKAEDTPVPLKTSAETKTVAKSDDTKIQKQADGKIILDTEVVNVIISVTDPYGRFVTGLGKDHFEVFDDKIKQQIAHFTDEDAPVSLGIVYDVSGSMKERVARSVRALRRYRLPVHCLAPRRRRPTSRALKPLPTGPHRPTSPPSGSRRTPVSPSQGSAWRLGQIQRPTWIRRLR